MAVGFPSGDCVEWSVVGASPSLPRRASLWLTLTLWQAGALRAKLREEREHLRRLHQAELDLQKQQREQVRKALLCWARRSLPAHP